MIPRKGGTVMASARKLLVVGLLMATAPGLGQAAAVLHRPLEAEPETLDPPRSSSLYDAIVESDLFEGLVVLDGKETVLPGVAERWEVAPDGVTWTFHLREDARWSNGDAVTAQDFVFAWRRTVDPATAAADTDPIGKLVNAQAILAGKITDRTKLGVEALDDHTLRAVTAAPSPTFLKQCSYRFAYPLHRATIERWGQAWTQPGHIVGNGPFVMKSWVPQSAITLGRSPTYWNRESIRLDEVDHIVVENDQTALKLFRSGELDFVRAPSKEIPGLRQNHDPALHTGRDNSISFIFFNMKEGVLAGDRRLREALALAFDPVPIAEKVLPRGNAPAYDWVPPTVPDYTRQEPAYLSLTMAERLARARQLYAEAGYGPDHPLKLTVNYATFEDTKTLMQVAAQMWKQALGAEITLDNEEFRVYLGRVDRGDFQIGTLGWRGGLRDPEAFLEIWDADRPGVNNAHYADARVQALLKSGATTMNAAERRDIYQRAERLIVDDVAGVPVAFAAVNALVGPRLDGWDDDVALPQSRFLSIRATPE